MLNLNLLFDGFISNLNDDSVIDKIQSISLYSFTHSPNLSDTLYALQPMNGMDKTEYIA